MQPADVVEQVRGELVVAVDASPPSAAALRFAADLAGRTGADLHVVLVWNVVIGPGPDTPAGTPATEQDRQSAAERVLAEFVASTLDSAGAVSQHAVHANVDALLREVSTSAAHLVVGTRGRGGVADLVLGSVSADLVNHARCPVTVVPPA